jgi:hypothetical protein
MRVSDALVRTTGVGLASGAALGLLLAWIVFVKDPVISGMILDGPAPARTLLMLCGVLSSFFAVGAALTSIVLHLMSGD